MLLTGVASRRAARRAALGLAVGRVRRRWPVRRRGVLAQPLLQLGQLHSLRGDHLTKTRVRRTNLDDQPSQLLHRGRHRLGHQPMITTTPARSRPHTGRTTYRPHGMSDTDRGGG
jgi:hypothetical protein